MRANIALATAAASSLLAVGPAVSAQTPWPQVIHEALAAEYAVGVGQSVFANLFGSTPKALCTGWQARVGTQIREYTAVHCIGYWVQGQDVGSTYIPTHWDVWGQVDVRGLRGPWVHEAGLFSPSNTTMWGYDDVAYTTAVPIIPGSIVGVGSGAPLASRYFTIAGWQTLYPGEECAVVGDGMGGWFTGNAATVTYLTFEGMKYGYTYNTAGPGMPPKMQLGWAEVFKGNAVPGESGSPVLNSQGQVVGVLVAGGDGITAAVPLDAQGLPVVAPGQVAEQTEAEAYGN
ncbi:MAG: hypothetical protein M0Z47_10860 [Actinomycetota bacterium]|nr:hypothetical protein [Actinomycetota bacterium]